MTTAACEQVAGNVRASLAAGYVTMAQVATAISTAVASDGCQQPAR